MQGPKGKYPAIKAGDYVKQAFKPQFDAKQVRCATSQARSLCIEHNIWLSVTCVSTGGVRHLPQTP